MLKNTWTQVETGRGGLTFKCCVGKFVLEVTNEAAEQPGFWLGFCSGLFNDIRLNVPSGDASGQDAQEIFTQMVIEELRKVVNTLATIPVTRNKNFNTADLG